MLKKKPIKFMCTAFRDGFQSVYGARVLVEDYLPAIQAAVAAGINWFETGGGAMFQSQYFYSNQDAFVSMDKIREAVGKDVNLQTLARGVNVVGLTSQPSDVIKAHAELFKKHGVTTIRNFDALNDVNNLIYSGQCIHDAGLKHQVAITLMELPPGCTGAHDAAFYEKILREILDAGIPFDSVCFKDASGTAVPSKVYETIKRARKLLPADVMLDYHTHETAGVSVLAYKMALDAGADAIDLSMAPASGGTCQPDISTMWHALRGTEYDLGIDIDKVMEAEKIFKECMADYFLPPEATMVEPLIPWSPMPGGALTANTQMMRDNGIMDRYNDVIVAMSEVVRRGGFGTSVTPVSQFYFQQAFNNVMFGPWKKIADGYGKMVLGYFGRTPVPADPEIIKIASEQLKLEPTTKTSREIDDADPKKGLKVWEARLKKEGIAINDENVFIAACCEEKGIDFLLGNAKLGIRKNVPQQAAPAAGGGSGGYTVTVNGQTFAVQLNGGKATVNGASYDISVADGISEAAAAAPAAAAPAAAGGATEAVNAPMPGSVFRLVASEGDQVAQDDVLLVIEAMKMEIEVKSPSAGRVTRIAVNKGDQITAGQLLVQLN